MNPNPINQSPFLRTARQFPVDMDNLRVELNTMYNEVSTYINDRSIALFPINRPSQIGDAWYLTTQKQNALRQVYTYSETVPPTPLTVAHNINLESLTNFTRIWGTFYNATAATWNTLPYVDIVAANQIYLTIDSANINIIKGAGAPTITNALIILEWIAHP